MRYKQIMHLLHRDMVGNAHTSYMYSVQKERAFTRLNILRTNICAIDTQEYFFRMEQCTCKVHSRCTANTFTDGVSFLCTIVEMVGYILWGIQREKLQLNVQCCILNDLKSIVLEFTKQL